MKLTAHCSVYLYIAAGKSLIAINGDPKLADELNNCYKSIITSRIPHLDRHSRRIELYCVAVFSRDTIYKRYTCILCRYISILYSLYVQQCTKLQQYRV